jgi:flagellar basal body-associated protein FliL
MTSNQQASIRCANCGMPVAINVHNIIDAKAQPELKSMLLHDQLNTAVCSQCGHLNRVASPLLYHDAEHEMLVAWVPMELGTGQQDTEKVVGDLMNQLMANVPKEQFKAYMFNPRRALTLQGIIDQIIEADGLDPEAFAKQKARVQLLQTMLTTTSESALTQLIADNDDAIDMDFFQSLTVTAEQAQAQGRQDIFQKLLVIQQFLLENSTLGKDLLERQNAQEGIIRAVAERVEALGEQATRADFFTLALELADDEMQLQALVGLVRPAFDYQFFEEVTQKIEATEGEERTKMEQVRDSLLQYSQSIDAQAQQTLQAASQFLQVLVNTDNIDEVIANNAERIDDDFMNVLVANIQEANKHQNVELSQRLQHIYSHVVSYLQSQMPPEMQFINELLGIQDDNEIKQRVDERAVDVTENMPTLLNEVQKILESRGQAQALQRLDVIRSAMMPHLQS